MSDRPTKQQAHERTYRMADGSLILGDYGYMAELDGWADDCDPCDVIEEEWVLVRSRTVRIGTNELCTKCGGDEYATMDDQGRETPDQCPRCSSTGAEPRDVDPLWTSTDDERALHIGRAVMASQPNSTAIHSFFTKVVSVDLTAVGWNNARAEFLAAGEVEG